MKKISVCALCLLLAVVIVLPISASGTRDVSAENAMAVDLRELGLFNGVSETNFDLERTPTRVEVIVMLIRILGKEAEAQNGTWSHPFTDVPQWADKYVGYAYENGLTQGISATKFGVGNASAATYLTFMLRALGYSDQNNLDFSWSDPYSFAKQVGILPDIVNTKEFWRADIVTISYAALGVDLKDSDMTLGEKLISAGVFTTEAYMEYFNPENFNITYTETDEKTSTDATLEMNANQVYEKCSSAVFYIEVYDKNGQMYASGSGFFIDENGMAVTNYHVIQGASSAKIMTRDDYVYDVSGIYDYNADEDWAVLKIDGKGFDYLEISDADVSVGETIYAIGSPVGYDDTISTGIVSSAARAIDGVTYIQISAPISHGSSGGALLNMKGEVIGITSAGVDSAQNLNFALPISCIKDADLTDYTEFKSDIAASMPKVNYTLSQEAVTLKEGKEVSIDLKYELENTDIEKTMIKLQSQDASVARAYFKSTGKFPWEIVIVGVGDGETTVLVSNELTDDTVEIHVTVQDNKVYGDVLFYPQEYKHTVYTGESNIFEIKMIKYNIPEDIEISYAAQVLDKKKAKIEWVMENGKVGLKVTGLSAGVTTIVFTNTLNKKTLSVPLTVYPSYEQNLSLLKECVRKEGVYDSTNKTYTVTRYDEENTLVYMLVYSEAEDKIYFGMGLNTLGKPMSILVEVTAGNKTNCVIIYDGGIGALEFDPRTFNEYSKLEFMLLSGDEAVQMLLKNHLNLNKAIMSTLFGCDELILADYDLYFEDFGYECFNRRFHY